MKNTEVRLTVAQRRRALGWTQSDLASMVGVSRQTLIAIEHGHTRIHLDLAIALADALQVPLDTLVGRPPHPQNWRWFNDVVPIGSLPVVWATIADQVVVVPYYLTGDAGHIDAWWDAEARQLMPTPGARHPSRVILIGGCDPYLSWLKSSFEHQHATHAIEIIPTSSTAAVDRLRRGFLHLAGSHWYNPAQKAYNVWDSDQGPPLARLGYLQWEEGIFWHPGQPEPKSWAVREVGSEARAVFERTKDALKYPILGPTFDRYQDLTRYVLTHEGIGGLGLGSLAVSLGLTFRALTEEPYEWVLHRDALTTDWLSLLLQTLERSDLKTRLARPPHQVPFHWGQID